MLKLFAMAALAAAFPAVAHAQATSADTFEAAAGQARSAEVLEMRMTAPPRWEEARCSCAWSVRTVNGRMTFPYSDGLYGPRRRSAMVQMKPA